jgi:hypothetical protein
MEDKKIKVKISKLGKPVIEAIGFAGCGCTEATKPIEDAFGGDKVRIDKPEMHQIGEVEGAQEETMSL